MTTTEVLYDYRPWPKQALAHRLSPQAKETLFGGAAGPGKSRWSRAEAIRMCLMVPGARVVLFRRTHPDLERAVIDYFRAEMPRGVATYNISKSVWRFHNGSILELSALDNEADRFDFQGAEYSLVIFEELTQFTESQYTYLVGRLRATGKVLDRMNELGLRPRAISTSNPGGIGHSWVKARFVDAGIRDAVWQPPKTKDDPNPGTRVFIPGKLSDNPSIDQDDYTQNLQQGDPVMIRALLEGDWDILEGVRFTQWRRATHVIEPEQLPVDFSWRRCVAVDWGIGDPFCALWMALLPQNTVVVYREVYARDVIDTDQVQMILDAETEDERLPTRPIPVVLDRSAWNRTAKSPVQKKLEHGTDIPVAGSVARTYWDAFGGNLVKSQSDRIPGWALLDRHLKVRELGQHRIPGLLVYSNCRDLIRTLPALPRDKRNPEDVDTHAEDHAADALRYGLMYLAGGGQNRIPPGLPGGPTVHPITAGLREQGF